MCLKKLLKVNILNNIILVMLVFLRVLLLVSTSWAVQDITRYFSKYGGFYYYTGFLGRISENIGQRVEKKIVHKKVDIVPLISQVLDWTQKKPNIFRKENCMIINFG